MLDDYLIGTTSFRFAQSKRMDDNGRVSGQAFQEADLDSGCRSKLPPRTCIYISCSP